MLLEGLTWLLDHAPHVACRIERGDRLGRQPGAVAVEREILARRHLLVEHTHPTDVGVDVAPDLGGMERVPLFACPLDVGQHLPGVARRYR